MSKLGTMIVVGVDGTLTESVLDAGNPEQLLATVHDALGDYLELVPRFTRHKGQPCVAFCGESGKLRGLQPNSAATELWRMQVPVRTFSDFLAGPVVICTGPPDFMRAL
jgi:hypothetical protein